jgi:hypothetical protein
MQKRMKVIEEVEYVPQADKILERQGLTEGLEDVEACLTEAYAAYYRMVRDRNDGAIPLQLSKEQSEDVRCMESYIEILEGVKKYCYPKSKEE